MTAGMTRVVAGALVVALVGTVLAVAIVAGSGDEGRRTAAAPQGPAPLRTVFVGDSITMGVSPETFGPDESYSWVTYAVADDRSPWELQATVAVFGRTLDEMAFAFDDEVLLHDPQAVVIMGGTNDTLRGIAPEESVAALRTMVTSAQEIGAEVWVVAPPPLDPGYGRDPDALIEAERALAEELDVTFVDVRDDLAGSDGRWQRKLSVDGVHPSLTGARRIADLVLGEA